MPRYPKDQLAQTRERILAASDRLLKERGAGRSSIAEVMEAAGLTVGGFYAHFASKQGLEDATIVYGLDASMERLLTPLDAIADDPQWVQALIRTFLDQIDDPELGNASSLTLVLPDVARASTALRSAFSERTAAWLDRVATRFGAAAGLAPHEVAIAIFASLAGAVALARALPAPQARARVRRATEAMLAAVLAPDGAANS